MAKTQKKQSTGGVGTQPLITVDPSLPSLQDHPFFKKKTAAAKEVLKRVGLPKQLTKKSKG
jgi:hypothetical protein